MFYVNFFFSRKKYYAFKELKTVSFKFKFKKVAQFEIVLIRSLNSRRFINHIIKNINFKFEKKLLSCIRSLLK